MDDSANTADFSGFDIPEMNITMDNLDFKAEGEFQLAELDDIEKESRYVRPKICRKPSLMAKNAQDLVDKLEIGKDSTTFVLVSGNFVFGDFFYNLIVRHNVHVLKLHLFSLSADVEQVERMYHLMKGGYVDALDLHLSLFFYTHERKRLIPVIRKTLDLEDRFQLAFSAAHVKMCLMETEDGRKIVMHGSANLRSSSSVEQLEICENAELYDFNRGFCDRIMEKYKTINKAVKWKDVVQ